MADSKWSDQKKEHLESKNKAVRQEERIEMLKDHFRNVEGQFGNLLWNLL